MKAIHEITKYIETKRFFLLFSIGLFFRFQHFFENRSLWTDEAFIPLRLLAFSFRQLIANFSFDPDLPVQPILFLLIEKGLMETLGNNEYVLRLFPLLCSILSMILFYKLIKEIIRPAGQLLAFSLFVFNNTLIYYAAEVKQYSSDLLAGIVLYLMTISFHSKKITTKQMIIMSATGTVFIFLSHPIIFILAGIVFYRIVLFIQTKERQEFKKYLRIFYIWGISFVVFFMKYVQGMVKSRVLINSSSEDYLPWPFWNREGFQWLLSGFTSLFTEAGSLYPAAMIMILFIIGSLYLWKKEQQKWFLFSVPLVLVLIASALHKYPFRGRFLIFLIPMVIYFVVEGSLTLIMFSKKHSNKILTTIFIFLIIYPLYLNISEVFYGREKENMRPVMHLLKEKIKPQDIVYLNNGGNYAYFYYLRYFDIEVKVVPLKRFSDNLFSDERGRYIKTMDHFPSFNQDGNYAGNIKFTSIQKKYFKNNCLFGKEPRTWLIFSHYKDSKKEILEYIENKGKQELSFEAKGAAIYLYNFSALNQQECPQGTIKDNIYENE